jgi:hypothetical protein
MALSLARKNHTMIFDARLFATLNWSLWRIFLVVVLAWVPEPRFPRMFPDASYGVWMPASIQYLKF